MDRRRKGYGGRQIRKFGLSELRLDGTTGSEKRGEEQGGFHCRYWASMADGPLE